MHSDVGSGPASDGLARIEQDLFRAANLFPDKAAIVDGKDLVSYAALIDQVARGASLLGQLGVTPGDRVAMYFDKTIRSVVAFYSAWSLGAVPVPIEGSLKASQVSHILDHSGARILLSSEEKLSGLPAETYARVRACAFENEAQLTSPLAEQPTEHDQGHDDSWARVTPAVILYTSGSTGRPKGILLSHANLIAGARIVSRYLELSADERILSVLPFSFDYGLNQLLTSVREGATLVLQRSKHPAEICRSLADYAITGLAGVPPLWMQLMGRFSPLRTMTLPHLRYITNSGGHFPLDLVGAYRKHFPKVRVYLMYGLTEAFRSTYLPPDEIDRRPGSIGKAIPETEIIVLTEDGREALPGEEGELVHAGPTVALEYWNDPSATAEKFRAHPFRPATGERVERVVFSGDYVKSDEDGFLYFLGRRDGMLKPHGIRVSPEEVEEIVHASGLVAEAVIQAIPDPVASQVLVLHVVPKDSMSFSEEALWAFCRKEMPRHMIPKSVHIHEELPRTSSGKIDRKRVGCA